MNNVRHNQLNFKLAIFRFRESNYYEPVFYGSIILFCLLLIIYVMIPLTENYFSVNKAVNQSRQRIATLTQNINYLSTLSSDDVSQKLLLANAMFPKTKDFNGAIQAVNGAASEANTTIGSFSFNGVDTNTAGSSNDSLLMSASLLGDSNSIAHFLQSIENKVPLASVQSISMEGNAAIVIIQFAYQPYVEKNIDLTQSALFLAPKTLSLLQQAASWESAPIISSSSAVATGSASGTLPPF